jgi:plastocyanin
MSMARRVAILMVLAAALLALVVGGAGSAPFQISVADGGLKYSPKTAHVTKGKAIKWTNEGSGTHTVSFYKKPSGSDISSITLGSGDSKKRKPDKTGTYKYRCMIANHSSVSDGQCTGMCGKLKIHN